MENPEKYFMINKGSFVQFRHENILKYYDIQEKEIGRGAYGVVFRAKQKQTHHYRAVKCIPKKMIKSMNSLMAQIQNLAILDHPGIIKIFETFQDKKSVFIVTDLCQGGQLLDCLDKKGKIAESDARQIFLQIIQTIKYYNSKNISHRDLKPENFVFLNQTSLNIKLIDFGLSFKWNHCMKTQLKQKNQNKLIGTPYYIAPQIIDGQYDQRCDIWSAGVILYIILTGFPPFRGQNLKQVLSSVKKGHVKMGINQFKQITPQCKDMIARILQPEQKRISIEDIFNHPWIKLKVPREPLKINFHYMTQFVNFSKLKKITAAFITFRLSQRQIEVLLNLFRQIDTNNDGYISVQQLHFTLQSQKQNKTFQELLQITSTINTQKTNKINYTEFLASNLDESYILKKTNLLQVFKIIDADKNGIIDKQQLKNVLVKNKMINLSINGKEVDQIMFACDKNKDGKIDFEEFVSYLSDE